jgi:hypothetical protein
MEWNLAAYMLYNVQKIELSLCNQCDALYCQSRPLVPLSSTCIQGNRGLQGNSLRNCACAAISMATGQTKVRPSALAPPLAADPRPLDVTLATRSAWKIHEARGERAGCVVLSPPMCARFATREHREGRGRPGFPPRCVLRVKASLAPRATVAERRTCNLMHSQTVYSYRPCMVLSHAFR